MIECRCPHCRHLFGAKSSGFGAETTCISCGQGFVLDTDVLAHFEFPSEITVRLADSTGKAVRLSGLTIKAERGFAIGDVLTDAEGTARITKEHYEQSQRDWYAWSIMDHPGDHSLNRFLTLWVEGPQPFGPERIDLEHSGTNPIVWLKEKSGV